MAILGIIKKINCGVMIKCSFCNGTGSYPESSCDEEPRNEPCSVCKGKGSNVIKGDPELLNVCTYCNGSGKDYDDGYFLGSPCVVCKGSGVVVLGDDIADLFWDLLHPKVTALAKTRFEAGYYADAVETVLKEINSIVKKIYRDVIGEDCDGAVLMNNAFSPNRPVIELADLSTKSGKSIQTGYMNLFSGAMIGIRNPKAHENLSPDKQRTIHLLFLGSLLMCKLDEGKILTNVTSPAQEI